MTSKTLEMTQSPSNAASNISNKVAPFCHALMIFLWQSKTKRMAMEVNICSQNCRVVALNQEKTKIVALQHCCDTYVSALAKRWDIL
jgi:hypothetical protein